MFENLFRRKLTKGRFADRFRTHLASQSGISNVTFDESRFRLTFCRTAGDQGVAFLNNAFSDASKVAPAQVDGVIRKYVASLLENSDAQLARLLHTLMPIIRDRSYFALADLTVAVEAVEAEEGEEGLTVPWRPLTDKYAIAVAIDTENAIRPVQAKAIAEAGLDFEDLMTLAVANLRERTTPNFTRLGDGVFVSGWQDVYDASSILLPELLHQLPLRGAPVVAIPSRNHLFVTGDCDLPGLREVVSRAGRVVEEDTRPLTPQLMIWRDGGWHPFAGKNLDDSSLLLSRRRILRRDYDQQTTLLKALHERRNIDIFVAQLQLATNKDRTEEFSITTWSKGVDTLLPIADRLSLVDLETKEVILIDWSAAMEIAGDRLVLEREWVPKRYRATTFPDEAELHRLRSAAAISGHSR